MSAATPRIIQRWHDYIIRDDEAVLDALLSEDVVFESPVVFKPQVGKAITFKYLRAAAVVLNSPAFRYAGEWYTEYSAILEFETEIDGISVNGIDMIHWNDQEKITRFKVMVRPLKAINMLHQKMGERLLQMS